MTKKWIGFCLLLSAVALAGCVTTLTNLTATTQQTIKPRTIQPYVVIGFDTYEMRPTYKMTNRWEALIPIPPDKNVVTYRFKVDYEFARFGKPGKASKASPEYKLYIK